MFLPSSHPHPERSRSHSDSMDYEEPELAEIHDKREREAGEGPKYVAPPPLPPTGVAGGVAHLHLDESDEDTEDASEDGDLRNPFHLGVASAPGGGMSAIPKSGGGLLTLGTPNHPLPGMSGAGPGPGSIDNNNEGETEENERRLKEQ